MKGIKTIQPRHQGDVLVVCLQTMRFLRLHTKYVTITRLYMVDNDTRIIFYYCHLGYLRFPFYPYPMSLDLSLGIGQMSVRILDLFVNRRGESVLRAGFGENWVL